MNEFLLFKQKNTNSSSNNNNKINLVQQQNLWHSNCIKQKQNIKQQQ